MRGTRSSARIVTTALVATTLFGSTFQVAQATRASQPAAVKKTKNLIKNPGAEAGVGSSDGTTVPVPDWGRDDVGATPVKYGAAGGFPDAHTPGPPKRGHNFFAGGRDVSNGTFFQKVSIAKYKNAINAGHVTFALKAWLGGFANDPDYAYVTLNFMDGNDDLVGSQTTIGPVSNTQRHNQTKFLSRSATGSVPGGAVSVFIVIRMTRVSGGPYNDGYADNLSLILNGV
jgi:hypothetical protein